MNDKLDQAESWLIVIVTGLLILWAELLLAAQRPIPGLLLYSAILLLLLLYGAFRWPHPQHQLLVLVIPSISRLLAYTLPLGDLAPIFAHLVLSLPLGITAVTLTWVLEQKRPFISFSWRRAPSYLLFIALGAAGGLLLYQIQPTVPLAWDNLLLLLFTIFVLVVAMAALEEWLFRGIMQTTLSQLWGAGWPAVIVVAVFYTLLSVGRGSAAFSLTIFALALLLGGLQRLRQNLFDVCLTHGALNLVYFLILPGIWIKP